MRNSPGRSTDSIGLLQNMQSRLSNIFESLSWKKVRTGVMIATLSIMSGSNAYSAKKQPECTDDGAIASLASQKLAMMNAPEEGIAPIFYENQAIYELIGDQAESTDTNTTLWYKVRDEIQGRYSIVGLKLTYMQAEEEYQRIHGLPENRDTLAAKRQIDREKAALTSISRALEELVPKKTTKAVELNDADKDLLRNVDAPIQTYLGIRWDQEQWALQATLDEAWRTKYGYVFSNVRQYMTGSPGVGSPNTNIDRMPLPIRLQ